MLGLQLRFGIYVAMLNLNLGWLQFENLRNHADFRVLLCNRKAARTALP